MHGQTPPKWWDNEARARQLICFDGMQHGNMAPTDFDAVFEYRGKAWLIFEVKHGDKAVPTGQRLALERFVEDAGRAGKLAIAVVAEHSVHDPKDDVMLAECPVREVYASSELSWRAPKRPMVAKECEDDFLAYVERRR